LGFFGLFFPSKHIGNVFVKIGINENADSAERDQEKKGRLRMFEHYHHNKNSDNSCNVG